MSCEKEREALLSVYPNQTWRDKVKKMPDAKVIAIFMRLKSQKKL